MKAQFRYAALAGLRVRGPVFVAIFIFQLVSIVLGTLGAFPFAAHVTAVSISGTAIAVMMAVNIVGDVSISRRMFAAPGAYLHALTPAPRRKTLLASVVTMMVMDIVSMATVIIGEVWLSFNLAGENVGAIFREAVRANASEVLYWLICIGMLVAGYLLVMMIIMFCISVRRSVLYSRRAGGLLTAVLAIGVSYVFSLSTFLVAPFGSVSRYGMFFTISLGRAGLGMYVLLMLIEASALFVVTSKLMERKMNI